MKTSNGMNTLLKCLRVIVLVVSGKLEVVSGCANLKQYKYNALIQPVFDYCDADWGNPNKGLANKIQKLKMGQSV